MPTPTKSPIHQEVEALRKEKYKLMFEVSSAQSKKIEAQETIIDLKEDINILNERVNTSKRKHDELFTETTEELTRAYSKFASYKKLVEEAEE